VAYLGLTAGAFKTTDGGQHWFPAGLQGLDVLLLAVDRVQPNHLYAYAQPAGRDGAPPGIYTSANGGGSWTARHDNLGGMALGALVADPLQAGTQAGVFETRDAGDTWTAIDDGLPSGGVIALQFTRQSPATLYAATAGGVYVLTGD
jgi:photosystem II stability/assembly factor-like uncharacterized protein